MREGASEAPPMEAVLAIAREAGELVLAMQKQVSLSIKPDGTVFTDADISSHNLIRRALKRLTPDIPVISEEQPAAESQKILAEASTFWAVDPLDVTANYAAGGTSFSVNIALVENGTPVLGVLLFPGLEELYYAEGSRAWRSRGREEPRAIRVAPANAGQATAAVRPHDRATHLPDRQNTLKLVFTRGQRRACLVATGEATFCSEREGFRIWDSAATYAIVTAAGGALVRQDGKKLRYDESLELPAYFVGHPELVRHLHPAEERPASAERKRKRHS